MSDYTTALPDKYDQFVCPFEPSHKVDAFRLQRHLIRCAQVSIRLSVLFGKRASPAGFPPGMFKWGGGDQKKMGVLPQE